MLQTHNPVPKNHNQKKKKKTESDLENLTIEKKC